jgi:RNA polymerase sigma factor (sigma-70 family)
MEVSALKFSGGIGLHGRSPLLRLQSDERLVALVRRGSSPAFEMLVSRYESRLLAFCRHLLGSREDAEDVLQEVMAAAYKAILADERPINVRPWLYRIARNRSLNHLRRASAVGVDSMDIHLSEHGASTADKAHQREDFRLLVVDIGELPETQRTALVLREMDALSYEQIAEAMETTVPSVKSLLVRARVSLAEAAEARLLTCDEVRDELGEVAEGLKRKPSPAVRRHLKACKRCDAFRIQLKETNRALAAILPLGPLVVLKKLAFTQLGHHAGSGAAAAGSGATAAGSGAGVAGGTAAGSGIVAGSTAGGFGFVSAGLGAIASKAAIGFAAAAVVTAGAVEVDHTTRSVKHHATPLAAVTYRPHTIPATTHVASTARSWRYAPTAVAKRHLKIHRKPAKAILVAAVSKVANKPTPTKPASSPTPAASTPATTPGPTSTTPPPGRTQTETVPTVLTPAPTDLTPVTTTTPVVTTAPPATTPTSTLLPPPSTTTPAPPTGTGPTGTPPTGGGTGIPTPPTGPGPAGTVPPGGPAGGGPAAP